MKRIATLLCMLAALALAAGGCSKDKDKKAGDKPAKTVDKAPTEAKTPPPKPPEEAKPPATPATDEPKDPAADEGDEPDEALDEEGGEDEQEGDENL